MLEGVLGLVSIAYPQNDFIERFSPKEKGKTKEQLDGVEDGREMPFRGDHVRVGEHASAHEISDEVVEQCRDCFR
jgi:hypothetical protein